MNSKFSLVLASILLVACTKNSTPISWHEKHIQSLHLEKKKVQMDMATQLKNQKACEDYGKENWGETNDFGDWSEFQEFHYSPLYDKCFVKRTADNLKKDEHQIVIFDLLSGSSGSLFSYSSWCRDVYIKNHVPVDEDACPSAYEINQAWLSLLGENE